jgi:hypothetical protein
MKHLVLSILFSTIVLLPQVGLSDGGSNLSAIDKTEQWKFPYEVESQRANALHEGLLKLAALNKKSGIIKVADALKFLGPPDMVTDLESAFAGLSPEEDGYLVVHRPELKWRLVWFLRKKSELPNVNDTWIGIYTKKNTDQIANVILK